MSGEGNEVIIEILQVGNAVKVIAVDAKTGLEVSIVGSPSMSEEMLKRNAFMKLNYMLEKQNAGRAR
ncbi:MAG: DUF6898 family protein [Alphaproteobacteria bacterium]